MKKKTFSSFLCWLSLFLFSLPQFLPAWADPSKGGPGCASDQQSTAIGCIPLSIDSVGLPSELLTFFLRWAFGISGGIILLMLIFTGYSLATSGGNPEKLQAVKENVVSILSGALLIVFSIVLLRTIGADVLILPTFR